MRFLGHVSADGIGIDPDKVAAITTLTESDLMERDSDVLLPWKIRVFLGMVVSTRTSLKTAL